MLIGANKLSTRRLGPLVFDKAVELLMKMSEMLALQFEALVISTKDRK